MFAKTKAFIKRILGREEDSVLAAQGICAGCRRKLGENELYVELFKADGTLIRILCHACDTGAKIGRYKKTGRITTSLAIDVQIAETNTKYGTPLSRCFKPIQTDLEKVYGAIRKFNAFAWAQIVAASDAELVARGLSCELFGGVKVMTWTMCGRIMVTIEDREHSITIMGCESGNGGCSFRGIDASADNAVRLLLITVAAANNRKLELKPDKGVSYCGI